MNAKTDDELREIVAREPTDERFRAEDFREAHAEMDRRREARRAQSSH